jgi:hypothetical protein
MQPTDMNTMEKGEYVLLVKDAEVVKPQRNRTHMMMKKARGFPWLKALCWMVAVLVALLLVSLTGGYFWVRHQVQRFTVAGMDDLPHPPLPVAPLPEAEVEVVKDKTKLFWDLLRAGTTTPESLTMTQDELNGIIASSDYLRGHAFASFTDNGWSTELVLPADHLPGGKGRYFAGKMVFTIENKALAVSGSEYDGYDQEEIEDTVGTHVSIDIIPKHKIPDLYYPFVLAGKFLARTREDINTGERIPVLEMEYGQFLNWVAPDDWLERKTNLLRCDEWDSSSSSSSSSSDDSGDGFDWDDDDCQEFMDTLARVGSVQFQEGQIVVEPHRKAFYSRRHLVEGEMGSKASFVTGPFVRRALRHIF